METNVVFLHGLCGSQDNFSDLQKYFANSSSFDLIGFGRERKPDKEYDKECFLRFLETKIRSQCVLVGHSMGAILAKEFAIRHPNLIKRVYAIGYPLQKTPEKMEAAIRRDGFMAMYLDGNMFAKFACRSKIVYKYLLMPFGLIFYPKRFLSFWHYFSHTYESASNSIKNTILRDEYESIAGVKDRVVFISGDKDLHVDEALLQNYRHELIPGMGHIFFGYENEIAGIIKQYEEENDKVSL